MLDTVVLPVVTLIHKEFLAHPLHIAVEIFFGIIIAYFLTSRPYVPQSDSELTEKEEEELIKSWNPTALLPDVPNLVQANPPVIAAQTQTTVVIEGKECENFSSSNFLGLATHPDVVQAASDAVDTYGVGSCGPRGFYGTIKPHLDLENRLAKHFGTEKGIIYSYSYSTISSVIPSFAARGDRVIYDIGVNQALQTGIQLARCEAKSFPHNDTEALRKIVAACAAADAKQKTKRGKRKYIVVEGVYKDHGDIVNLPAVAAIATEFKYRIIVDDSFGFGVLGKTGRGVVEHYEMEIDSVDLYVAALCNSLGGVGGFCVGHTQVIDHQRLSSTGYCFSASLPAFLSVASLKALDILDSNPQLLQSLRNNVAVASKILSNQAVLQVHHADPSPLFHLRLAQKDLTFAQKERLLQQIVEKVLQLGFAISRSSYNGTESVVPEPSIRFTVTAQHSEDSVKQAVLAIIAASNEILTA